MVGNGRVFVCNGSTNYFRGYLMRKVTAIFLLLNRIIVDRIIVFHSLLAGSCEPFTGYKYHFFLVLVLLALLRSLVSRRIMQSSLGKVDKVRGTKGHSNC